MRTVVHTAPAAGGQPVVLRNESGADKGCFFGLNQGYNPFRVAGEEMLAKQAPGPHFIREPLQFQKEVVTLRKKNWR